MAEVCKANIGKAGKRRRMQVGWVGSIVSVALIVAFAIFHVPWQWRTFVFLPSALAATGFLQAMRNTCVAHAARGTIEHEDFSTTPAPPDELAASRRVAATIRRDAVIVGFATTIVSVALAFL
jgi:hypothetical protein